MGFKPRNQCWQNKSPLYVALFNFRKSLKVVLNLIFKPCCCLLPSDLHWEWGCLLLLLFLFFQALPALPSCADCVSESVWVDRAYIRSISCTCLSRLRTSSYTDKPVTIFTWKRKRNKWLCTPKLLYQRKKKSKTSFTVYSGYQTLLLICTLYTEANGKHLFTDTEWCGYSSPIVYCRIYFY